MAQTGSGIVYAAIPVAKESILLSVAGGGYASAKCVSSRQKAIEWLQGQDLGLDEIKRLLDQAETERKRK